MQMPHGLGPLFFAFIRYGSRDSVTRNDFHDLEVDAL